MSEVLAAIAGHSARQPHRAAVASGNVMLSYATLERTIAETASRLAPLLSRAEGAVAFKLENGLAWVLLDLALQSLGRAALPLPTFFNQAQIDAALSDSGAGWLIVDEDDGSPILVGDTLLFLRKLKGDKRRLPKHTAKVSYTSGSTGAPKGVCLARSHMDRVARSIVTRFGLGFAGVHAAVLPLGVLLENVAGLYAVLLAGGLYRAESAQRLGCTEPFKPDFMRMAATLHAVGATSLILVPELLRGLLAARAFGGFDSSRLRLIAVGGAKVALDLVQLARGADLPVYEGYGLTECGSVVAVNAPGADRSGSVGRPLDHVKIAIAADGEIIVRGETYLGYAGHARAPNETPTGDIGSLDEQGFLHIDGRKSNLIITAFGRNIAPEWVESELLAEPLIRHAVVFGEGQAELRALIAPLNPNVDAESLSACVARANARLPTYARVGAFKAFAPDKNLHFTANGKLRRAAITAAHADFANG